MEERLLRYFYTVAQLKNFTKAAKILHITQPTLSRQIKELEADVGALFVRTNRGLTLTETGEFLANRAEVILQLNEQLEKDLRARQTTELTGVVRIGCVEGAVSHVLMKQIKQFSADYSRVNLQLVTASSDILTQQLANGMIDVAFLLSPPEMINGETIILPSREQVVLVVNAKHKLAERTVITPQDLMQCQLWLSYRPEIQQSLANWAQTTPANLPIKGTFNLLHNVWELLACVDVGLIAINSALNHRDMTNVVAIPLAPAISFQNVLSWRNLPHLPAASAFIERLKSLPTSQYLKA